MNEDYLKVLKIIEHPNNEQKHLSSIQKIIRLFKNKWNYPKNPYTDIYYLENCTNIDKRFISLKEKICKN